MKTINIAFKHLEACRQAVITFAKAKNIQIPFSGPFRLDRKDFFSALPFSGYAVAYVAFSDNGKGLYAGYSHDCYGIQNYITSAPDGHGTVKQDWPQGNPDYIEFLASPAIPMSERAAAVDEAFGGMPEYVVSFIKLLCENGKARTIFGCIDEYEKLAHVFSNRTSAVVYSAVELNEMQKEQEEAERASNKLNSTIENQQSR